jgi:hypothetical protein
MMYHELNEIKEREYRSNFFRKKKLKENTSGGIGELN